MNRLLEEIFLTLRLLMVRAEKEMRNMLLERRENKILVMKWQNAYQNGFLWSGGKYNL